MKICFILPGRGRAGGIRSTVRVANDLLERRHEVRLLVYKNKRNIRSVLRNNWLRLRYPHTSNWLPYFKGDKETFTDIRRCAFNKSEVVIGTGLWACREIGKLSADNINKVHYIRGQVPWEVDTMKEAWSENIPKVAVASYLERTVMEICGQNVLAIIPNGIDITEYYRSVPESKRDGIGTIFGHGRHKDPKTLLAVLRKLCKDCPDVPHRVFGASSRPKELPRSSYVRFPTVDKARDIYSRSLVWILSSRSEGFPNPVLEAMACGCAVVATDCGGTRDIITNGENGFIVEVGNVGEIVDKVKLLLNNSALRKTIVRNSREIIKRFTWENSVDNLEKVLKSITAR